MKTQSNGFLFSAQIAIVTMLTLAGGLVAGLVAGNVLFEQFNAHNLDALGVITGLPTLLICLFGGGAVWGMALAKLSGHDAPRSLAKTGALTYGGYVLLVGVLLELVFGLLGLILPVIRLPIHHAFTLVFVPSAGAIAGLCSRRMAGELGYDQPRDKLALYTGLAAALGFFSVNMIMLANGWIVGGPGAAARFTMLRVMLTSNTGAALLGGAAFGWLLRPRVVNNDILDVSPAPQ